MPDVAGPGRAMVGGRVDPGRLGHQAIDLVHRRLTAGADVAGQASPARRRTDERVDDVVDVDIVTGVLTVTVDDHRLAGDQALGEDRHHPGLAVGILTGPVHVGQGQRGELDRVQVAVGDEVVDR